ncbi:MAG: type II toxin-antitoxin system HicB family antitoxin [Elusimicrobia bacterium]|nr:type II toxin-antitoxin system HicB family antitoxin [Elusimicrobiota bacterium]
MSYAVVLDKNDEGRWTVTCPVLPGCISEGDTKEDALRNIKDAIHLYLRSVKKELALLKHKGKQVVQVSA